MVWQNMVSGWSRFPLFIEPSYDVVMIDLRGHGMSDKPETGYSIEAMSEDLFWVVKTLNLDQACHFRAFIGSKCSH